MKSVSENMGFPYFRWFPTLERARAALDAMWEPADVSRGLPTAEEIGVADISDDDLPDFLATTRAVAVAYVGGEDLTIAVRQVVQQFVPRNAS